MTNSSSNTKRSRAFIGAGVGVLMAVGMGGWLLTRGHGAAPDKDAPPPPLVTVVVPSLGHVAQAVSLTGLISARNDLPIGNEGDAARIDAVLVEPGARVTSGQVLARLNPLTAQSQVDNATATLEEARANAAIAETEWARAQRGEDLFSKEETERRRTAAATAQAKSKAAEAQLADARSRLAHTVIRAPTDGLILTRTAEVGQIAVPGSTVLFRLARDGQIEMRGQVAEQDLSRLEVGQAAEVYLDGLAHAFTGQIWQIGAIIDPATRQGTVRIALPAGNPALRPGAFARAEVHVGARDGMVLPQTAVLTDDQGTYVYVVGADGKVARRGVSIAATRSDGLLISAGLDGHERVVAIAGAFLRSGETVAVATPPGKSSSATAAASAGGQRAVALR